MTQRDNFEKAQLIRDFYKKANDHHHTIEMMIFTNSKSYHGKIPLKFIREDSTVVINISKQATKFFKIKKNKLSTNISYSKYGCFDISVGFDAIAWLKICETDEYMYLKENKSDVTYGNHALRNNKNISPGDNQKINLQTKSVSDASVAVDKNYVTELMESFYLLVKKSAEPYKLRKKIESKIKKPIPNNAYSIESLSSLYKKMQKSARQLEEIEKLIKRKNELLATGEHPLEETQCTFKIMDFFHKLALADISPSPVVRLQSMERSWHILDNKEKQKLNKTRNLMINNSIRKNELYDKYYNNKKRSINDPDGISFSSSSRSSLQKQFEDDDINLSFVRERLQYEESIINKWMLDGPFFEKNIMDAINYLEKYHIYSEWCLFSEKEYQHYVRYFMDEPEIIIQLQKSIDSYQFIKDKMTHLANKIFAIFGSKIEEAREKIDEMDSIKVREIKKKIVKEGYTLTLLQDLLKGVKNGMLNRFTFDDLEDMNGHLDYESRRCDFYLSSPYIDQDERSRYRQIILLIEEIRKNMRQK